MIIISKKKNVEEFGENCGIIFDNKELLNNLNCYIPKNKCDNFFYKKVK